MSNKEILKIKLPFKTPTIKCKNCKGYLKPAGPNKIIGKDKKYCGEKECQAKRVSLWHKNRKHLEHVKERKRINQRNWSKSTKGKKYNEEFMKGYINDYQKKKRKKDEYFRRVERLRDRFRKAIREALNRKKPRAAELYGISFHEIAEYIGPQPGENYEIDHIRPICSFDLTKDVEIKKAFRPENHQWLTVKENRSKGGSYND